MPRDLVDGSMSFDGVAVVVVNFGSARLIADNLGWVASAGLARLIVVDNFRSQQDVADVRELAVAHGWELIELDRNVGFGAAVNVGAARAWDAETLVVVNPDLRLDRHQMLDLCNASRSSPDSLVSPRIVGPDGKTWAALGSIGMVEGRLFPTSDVGPPWLSGACLVIPRKLWRLLGGFDEDYFMYWEDVDLSFRTGKLGAGFLVLDSVVVVHDIGGTQGYGGKSRMYYRFNCRNRLLFASKNLAALDQLRWLLRTGRTLVASLIEGSLRSITD